MVDGIDKDAVQRALQDLADWANTEKQERFLQKIADLDIEIENRRKCIDELHAMLEDAQTTVNLLQSDETVKFVIGERIREIEEQIEKKNPAGLTVKKQQAEQRLRRLRFAAHVASQPNLIGILDE